MTPPDLVERLQDAWKDVKGDPAAMARKVLGMMPKDVLVLAGRESEVNQILMVALAVVRNPPVAPEEAGKCVIWAESLVSARDRKPYVTLRWGDEAGQFTPDEARAHAMVILECADAAVSDAFLFGFMTGRIGVGGADAGRVMAEFREFRKKRGEGES